MTLETLSNIGRNRHGSAAYLIFETKIAACAERLINMDG
jgi:hypothetical protein